MLILNLKLRKSHLFLFFPGTLPLFSLLPLPTSSLFLSVLFYFSSLFLLSSISLPLFISLFSSHLSFLFSLPLSPHLYLASSLHSSLSFFLLSHLISSLFSPFVLPHSFFFTFSYCLSLYLYLSFLFFLPLSSLSLLPQITWLKHKASLSFIFLLIFFTSICFTF